ncbi:hypothetical protein D9M72_515460 [compost metagenome]
MVSSESGCVCSGVILPPDIWSSNIMKAPPVSSALAFQIWTPPPKNQRRSPSPRPRTMGLMATELIAGLPVASMGLSLH